MTQHPNVLLIMTDQERYPPPYETPEIAAFRRSQLPGRERLRARSVEFHRHYCAATACSPSRTSMFTGHYPSLHGVATTDGLAKPADDPAMTWLDPDTVPTMGDWFRAAGYRTFYKGKWHLSHADLLEPGTRVALMANDDKGSVMDAVVERYRRADPLDGFGFSEWIGREPHGPARADTGSVRDDLIGDQVCDLFARLHAASDASPWLAVASLVNPHDIAFSGFGREALALPDPDDTVPEVPAAPSQDDTLDGRPACQAAFRDLWPQLLYPQPADAEYRRYYYWLHKLVDRVIERILDALDTAGNTSDTVVVLTSDHGEMLGAHGGQQQKWHNAYDETIRVPLLVSGPGVDTRGRRINIPTSHIDLLPTLLGLAGIDVDDARERVSEHHVETQSLVGRDLSALLRGDAEAATFAAPVYFVTEDQISRGLRSLNRFTGEPFTPVPAPANVESVVASLGEGDGAHVWKLSHYYERLPAWEAAHGAGARVSMDTAPDAWELHDLSADPEERHDRSRDAAIELAQLGQILDAERDAKRRLPSARNARN
jgi:arylsulfatase A-like enzyme